MLKGLINPARSRARRYSLLINADGRDSGNSLAQQGGGVALDRTLPFFPALINRAGLNQRELTVPDWWFILAGQVWLHHTRHLHKDLEWYVVRSLKGRCQVGLHRTATLDHSWCEVVCALKEARTLRRTNRDALMDIIIISIAQEVKTVHIAKPFSTLRVLEQLVLFTVSLNDCNDL